MVVVVVEFPRGSSVGDERRGLRVVRQRREGASSGACEMRRDGPWLGYVEGPGLHEDDGLLISRDWTGSGLEVGSLGAPAHLT